MPEPRDYSYYEILEVDQAANEETITEAYRAKIRDYHPDQHGLELDSFEELTKQINEAKEVLTDPDQRAVYDYFLQTYGDAGHQHYLEWKPLEGQVSHRTWEPDTEPDSGQDTDTTSGEYEGTEEATTQASHSSAGSETATTAHSSSLVSGSLISMWVRILFQYGTQFRAGFIRLIMVLVIIAVGGGLYTILFGQTVLFSISNIPVLAMDLLVVGALAVYALVSRDAIPLYSTWTLLAGGLTVINTVGEFGQIQPNWFLALAVIGLGLLVLSTTVAAIQRHSTGD